MQKIHSLVPELAALDNAELSEKIVKRHEEFQHLRRRTVEEGWRLGMLLAEMRARSKYGAWQEFLQTRAISPDIAQRLMTLYAGYDQIPQIAEFASVNEALKALKKPKEPAEEKPGPSKIDTLSKEDQRLMERDQLIEQAKDAEERAQKAQEELEEVKQQNEHLLQGEKVSEGFKQGISTIENLQAEVKQLKKQRADLRTELRQVKKEFANHKRWATKELKERDAQIERLKEGEQ